MRRGRYYLSRVIKLGELNQEKLMRAISAAPTVQQGEFDWTITDVVVERDQDKAYIFGNLVKYSRLGEVKIIDEPAKRQKPALANNLLEASAPFVYLPAYSGLAYLHVWNGIQEDVFPRRFKQIIEAAYDNFFVDCTLESLTDYRAFLDKLQSMDRVTELAAKVHPPNPLFGRLWESLNDYVKKRNAEEVTVRETSRRPDGISTQLIELIKRLLENPNYMPPQAPSITDAALLMAADGYGSGKAVGTEHGREVVIRTSESQLSFLFDKEPEPAALAEEARDHFARVSRERDMRH